MKISTRFIFPDVAPLLSFAAIILASIWMYSPTANAANAMAIDIDVSGPFLQHLTKDPHSPGSAWRCGEPEITQDVLHPATLVVDCMSAQINYQTPMANLFWSFKDVTKADKFHQPCYAFISHDGGEHWREINPDPLVSSIANSCADPMAESGPKGEVYLAEDGQHFPVNREYGSVIVQPNEAPLEFVGIVFTRSVDGGKTWSKLAPVPTAVDRPFWTVDESTGTVYDMSGCIRVTTIGEYGCTSNSRNLAVSANGGESWVPSVNISTQAPPTTALTAGHLHNVTFGGFASSISAARGIVGIAGVDGRAHNSVEFKYSADSGVTFTQQPIPIGGTPCTSPQVAGTAADPTRRGSFAVIVLCNPLPKVVRVFVTHDLGHTWAETTDLAVAPPPGYVTPPEEAQSSPSVAKLSTLITAIPTPFDVNRPWIAYGPTGALGVFWRENYGSPSQAAFGRFIAGPQDVFLAISPDGGTRFEKPVRLNTAASPAADPRQMGGDDTSEVILGTHYAYAVWGDWRSGELETWFARIPIPRN